MRHVRRVCIYSGSSNADGPRYRAAARTMGTLLASAGIGVVFGGGRVGLMGEVADAALAAGGVVIGVITQNLQELELGHAGCTELFVVESMHARKLMMAQLSDALIALPGGFGTMEEMFEATTWTQLNIHEKPVGILNVDGFYDALLAWIAHARREGFIKDIHGKLLTAHAEPVELLRALSGADIPRIETWIQDP
ncbi:MAG: TIGR00730 family Rossman fold protein [Myxococcota bacterium]|nr:TIGR00730 family Rossman fold protein [Myxococcota bacterium]